MKIELNDSEIKDAVAAYVATQGVSTEDKDVQVTLRAGRGENGYTAEIEVSAMKNPPAVTTNVVSDEDLQVANKTSDSDKTDTVLSSPADDDSLFKD